LSQYPGVSCNVRFKVPLNSMSKIHTKIRPWCVADRRPGSHLLHMTTGAYPSVAQKREEEIEMLLDGEAGKFMEPYDIDNSTIITSVYSRRFYQQFFVYRLHPYVSNFDAILSSLDDLSFFWPIVEKQKGEGEVMSLILPIPMEKYDGDPRPEFVNKKMFKVMQKKCVEYVSMSPQIRDIVTNAGLRMKWFLNPTASFGNWMNVLKSPQKGTLLVLDDLQQWELIIGNEVDPEKEVVIADEGIADQYGRIDGDVGEGGQAVAQASLLNQQNGEGQDRDDEGNPVPLGVPEVNEDIAFEM